MGPWLIKGVNMLLLAVSCYVVADVVTAVGGEALEPPPIQVEVQRDPTTIAAPSVSHVAILDRNLFGAQLVGEVQVVEEVPEDDFGDLSKTKLPLKLLGTAASTDVELSRASVENQKSRSSVVVHVGYKFDDLNRVRVKGIERARIILDNAGKLEELALYEDDGKQPERRPRKTPRQARRKPAKPRDTLNDRLAKLNGEDGQGISRLLSAARIVPHYGDDGSMLGMKVDAIKDDSLFQRVGLENGDVITEVNGVVVDRLEATSRIFDELSTADEINVAWQTQTGETKFFQGPADDLTGN